MVGINAYGPILTNTRLVWLSLWGSKIVAHFLPFVFQFVAGVVSSGTRKYALIIKALEIPLSLAGWAITSLATFIPVSLDKLAIMLSARLTSAAHDTQSLRPRPQSSHDPLDEDHEPNSRCMSDRNSRAAR